MRITKEQEEILDSLVCERFSSNKENEKLMETFVSKRGESLVKYFRRFGPEEDRNGNTAYYIIKNKEKEPLMFFSLKCGALFEPLQDENKVEQDFQRLVILLQAVQNADGNVSEDEAREVNEIINKHQGGDQISIEYLYKMIVKKARNKKDF